MSLSTNGVANRGLSTDPAFSVMRPIVPLLRIIVPARSALLVWETGAMAGDSQGKRKPREPLDEERRARLKALVFDTSSMGRGRPVLETLRQWAELAATNELELWIPEPVVWEWAEHIAEDLESAMRAAGDERRRLHAAEVPVPTWPISTRQEAIEHVLTAINDIEDLTVLELDGDDTIEALKDQLLGPASGQQEEGHEDRRGRLCVAPDGLREADEDFSTVLIVTGDWGAVDGAVAEWGTAAPVVAAHFDEARELLALTEPATLDQAWHILKRTKVAGYSNRA
jgi:hypothetical protein